MAEIHLRDKSIGELQDLARDIELELRRRGDEERKKALVKMKELAAGIGMTLQEVIAYSASKKTKGVAKYQNPDDPRQTWTGRGKRPAWIKAAIQQGRSLEELLID